jgi:hypothetical protein
VKLAYEDMVEYSHVWHNYDELCKLLKAAHHTRVKSYELELNRYERRERGVKPEDPEL